MKVVVCVRAELPAGPDSIWFTEDQLSAMSDAELADLLHEDELGVFEGAVWTIERAR